MATAFQAAASDALLFVNVHASDLADPDLHDGEAPLSAIANRVVLEITERTSLERIVDVRPRVHSLRKLGFRIAIDDLGAGYAGLGHLALLEPHVVKLDMSLIRDVDSQPTKRSVVRSIIARCDDLGLSVICEGIETVGERDTLVDLGCDLLQGYLVRPPGPVIPTAALVIPTRDSVMSTEGVPWRCRPSARKDSNASGSLPRGQDARPREAAAPASCKQIQLLVQYC
jgi:EAL domain-containing protein (putative c-di-GMP-specific phosphodiesterase class I)